MPRYFFLSLSLADIRSQPTRNSIFPFPLYRLLPTGFSGTSPLTKVHFVKTGAGIQKVLRLANEQSVSAPNTNVGARLAFYDHTSSAREQGYIDVVSGASGGV